MQLTDEQIKQLISHLGEKGVNSDCPFCLNGDWIINNRVYEMIEFNGGELVLGGEMSVFPVVAKICKKCGHVQLISPLVAGIISQPAEVRDGDAQ